MFVNSAVVGAAEDPGISAAWKPDTSKWSFDPSKWETNFKARMYQVGVGVGYASSLGLALPLTVGYGVFLFGLVKLNWVLVASCCAALYGWTKQKRLFLVAGVATSYALAFGVAPF
jgi:hypothetical protein